MPDKIAKGDTLTSRPPDGTKVFDGIADQYQEFRPEYPHALIEDIVALSGISPAGRILEIGCGPGKATLPFAQHGYRMLCLEPGPRLAACARERVRAWPQAEIAITTFEDWPLERMAFDLVMAASAFHWVREEVRYVKAAAALKGGGSLALFRNSPVGEDTELFRALRRVYEEYGAGLVRRATPWRPPEPGEDQQRAEIEAAGLFGSVVVRYRLWRKKYTAAEYVRYLDTYSSIHCLPEAPRTTLFQAVEDAVRRHGGVVDQPLVSTLHLAPKRSE